MLGCLLVASACAMVPFAKQDSVNPLTLEDPTADPTASYTSSPTSDPTTTPPAPTASAAPEGIFYVATTGDDSAPGSSSEPWRTIQKAADTLTARRRLFEAIRAGIGRPEAHGALGDLLQRRQLKYGLLELKVAAFLNPRDLRARQTELQLYLEPLGHFRLRYLRRK